MSVPISPAMLRDVRSQRHLSQEELARKSKVGVATIKRIESSDTVYPARLTTADRLCRALGLQLDDLSKDRFRKIVDLGGDVELHLDRYNDMETLREASENFLRLVELRNRLLNH